MTSRVLYQVEKGQDSLHFVFVGEDGEEDAVHGGSILEDAPGADSAADLAEAAFGKRRAELPARSRTSITLTAEHRLSRLLACRQSANSC